MCRNWKECEEDKIREETGYCEGEDEEEDAPVLKLIFFIDDMD